jgi:curved DNA-binding protein CbpA
MTPNYFENCTSLDEARSLYRKLAKENHPDYGGDTATMQEINRQWTLYQVTGAKTEARQRQQRAHAEGKKSAADFHDLDELGELLRVKVEALLNISPDLIVEVCGLWIWVTGDTKTHHAAIKAIEGMRYAHEKQAWYYAAVPSYNRTKRTLDEIRNMHGSSTFSRQPRRDEEQAEKLHA